MPMLTRAALTCGNRDPGGWVGHAEWRQGGDLGPARPLPPAPPMGDLPRGRG